MDFHLCGFPHVFSIDLTKRKSCHTWWTWMAAHLWFQATWFWVALATLSIFWLLIWVDPLMCFQLTWLTNRSLATHGVLKGLLTRVGPLMCFHLTYQEKVLSHCVHLEGFSPMWVLWYLNHLILRYCCPIPIQQKSECSVVKYTVSLITYVYITSEREGGVRGGRSNHKTVHNPDLARKTEKPALSC